MSCGPCSCTRSPPLRCSRRALPARRRSPRPNRSPTTAAPNGARAARSAGSAARRRTADVARRARPHRRHRVLRPNRGALITAGNGSTVPPGVWLYNGVRWRELATVCGASDGRIAWAGPDEFWTVSDGRPGQAPDSRGNPPPLQDDTLCHFAVGAGGRFEVVGSYATLGVPDDLLPGDARRCLPRPERLLVRRRPARTARRRRVPAALGRRHDDRGPVRPGRSRGRGDARLRRSVFQSLKLLAGDTRVKHEATIPPLRRIAGGTSPPAFESALNVPLYSFGESPLWLDALHLGADGEALWVAGGPSEAGAEAPDRARRDDRPLLEARVVPGARRIHRRRTPRLEPARRARNHAERDRSLRGRHDRDLDRGRARHPRRLAGGRLAAGRWEPEPVDGGEARPDRRRWLDHRPHHPARRGRLGRSEGRGRTHRLPRAPRLLARHDAGVDLPPLKRRRGGRSAGCRVRRSRRRNAHQLAAARRRRAADPARHDPRRHLGRRTGRRPAVGPGTPQERAQPVRNDHGATALARPHAPAPSHDPPAELPPRGQGARSPGRQAAQEDVVATRLQVLAPATTGCA